MSDIQEVLVVDTKTISTFTQGAAEGLDALLLDDRKVIVLRAVFNEIELLDPTAPTRVAFEAWIGSKENPNHAGKIIVPSFEVGVATPGSQHADDNIRAYAQELTDPTSSHYQELASQLDDPNNVPRARFLSDEKGIYLQELHNNSTPEALDSRGQSKIPYKGSGEWLADQVAEGNVTPELANTVKSNFLNSSIELTPDFKDQYTKHDYDKFNPSIKDKSYFPDTDGSVGVRTALVGGAGAALAKFGIIGDVLAFSLVHAKAVEFVEADEISAARKLWVSYVFDLFGGFLGGVVGGGIGFVLGTATTGIGGPLGALLGAVGGGIVTGLASEYIGGVLYDAHPNVFDKIFDLIDQKVAQLEAEGQGYAEALAEGIVGGLGFDASTVEGSADTDFLLGYKYGGREGNDGDDFLLAWQPEFVNAGEAYDPQDSESEIAETDVGMVLDGGADDDTIIIVSGERAIANGGDGADFLAAFGGQQHQLIGGAGEDTFLAVNSLGTIITTGDGADSVWWSSNTGVADLSTEDRVKLLGVLEIFGGGRSVTSESPWALGLGGLVRYATNEDGELIINLPWMPEDRQNMFILNWEDSKVDEFTGGGNITVFEFQTWTGRLLDDNKPSGLTQFGFWELFGLTLKTFTGENAYGGGDPLVLDLDGDGIELTTKNSISPQFDIDNDLYAERTAFVDPDDGALARDINGDGIINDASELFGYGTTSGFSVLAELDGNLDGVIDANDNGLADFNGDGTVDANDTYASLLVWQDLDRDIVTDAGEEIFALYIAANDNISSCKVHITKIVKAV